MKVLFPDILKGVKAAGFGWEYIVVGGVGILSSILL